MAPPLTGLTSVTTTSNVAAASADGAPTAPGIGNGGGGLSDALVQVGGVLMAVRPTTGQQIWALDGAVASADGRFLFGVAKGKLVRYLAGTAERKGEWALPAGRAWRVAVVGGTGAHVVLTDGVVDAQHRVTSTRLAAWHERGTGAIEALTEPGTIEPEAISPDGTMVFVLDHRATYYRVRTLSLADNQIFDTSARDKSLPPENMNGLPVRGVLSPDGRVLSTLYRVAGGAPFVHVLHLENGYSYCADLPAGDYTSMTQSLDGHTLYVGERSGRWLTLDLRFVDDWSDETMAVAVHATGVPPVPLASGGVVVGEQSNVAADATGISWFRDGALVARVDHKVDRLVTLVAPVALAG
jgi:hypothetical protein